MAILQTHNLNIGYRAGGKLSSIINNINIELNEGEMVCLLGANGKGKSTLLRTLAGVQLPLGGEIKIIGESLKYISKRKLAQILGLVYTDHTSAGGLTVTELVELGRHPHTGFLGRLSADDHSLVEKAMNDAGIAAKKNSFIADLSDGERQKAMIAKALAQQTPIIFLDEPTAFLDIASKIETMRLLHELAITHKKAILLSTHDISQALIFADKLLVIDKDNEITCGATEDLILTGVLSELFESENIEFNTENGIFTSTERFERTVSVSGDSMMLTHWLRNALRRNLYEPIDTENSDIKIRIFSPTKIDILFGKSDNKSVTSIHELLQCLSCYSTNIKLESNNDNN